MQAFPPEPGVSPSEDLLPFGTTFSVVAKIIPCDHSLGKLVEMITTSSCSVYFALGSVTQ